MIVTTATMPIVIAIPRASAAKTHVLFDCRALARRPLHDPRFAIGTGKLGELILALTAFLIGYESLVRLAQSGGHQLQRRQLR
jgi:hypothetical protein